MTTSRPAKRRAPQPKVRNATAAGAGIGTLITILSHAVKQSSTAGQVLLWATPALTSLAASLAFHLPKWLLFRWDLIALGRITKDRNLPEEIRKEADTLAVEMRAERSARVFRRVKTNHLESSEIY